MKYNSGDFRLLKRDGEYKDDFDILWFKIWRFQFKWFLECGEWFMYITWHKKDRVIGYRLSSAGNTKINYRNEQKRNRMENIIVLANSVQQAMKDIPKNSDNQYIIRIDPDVKETQFIKERNGGFTYDKPLFTQDILASWDEYTE